MGLGENQVFQDEGTRLANTTVARIVAAKGSLSDPEVKKECCQRLQKLNATLKDRVAAVDATMAHDAMKGGVTGLGCDNRKLIAVLCTRSRGGCSRCRDRCWCCGCGRGRFGGRWSRRWVRWWIRWRAQWPGSRRTRGWIRRAWRRSGRGQWIRCAPRWRSRGRGRAADRDVLIGRAGRLRGGLNFIVSSQRQDDPSSRPHWPSGRSKVPSPSSQVRTRARGAAGAAARLGPAAGLFRYAARLGGEVGTRRPHLLPEQHAAAHDVDETAHSAGAHTNGRWHDGPAPAADVPRHLPSRSRARLTVARPRAQHEARDDCHRTCGHRPRRPVCSASAGRAAAARTALSLYGSRPRRVRRYRGVSELTPPGGWVRLAS